MATTLIQHQEPCQLRWSERAIAASQKTSTEQRQSIHSLAKQAVSTWAALSFAVIRFSFWLCNSVSQMEFTIVRCECPWSTATLHARSVRCDKTSSTTIAHKISADAYVDYAAACDLLKPKKSCNNKYAVDMYRAFERALSVFSCKQYSLLWTCKNCKDAYKRWLCSQVRKHFIL